MDAPLSLSVRLTQPPTGSSPDVLATISLSSEPQGLTHTGDVLIAPFTEGEEKNIRWYLEGAPAGAFLSFPPVAPRQTGLQKGFL